MLLIGSRAMQHYLPNMREPRDWDIITTDDELLDWIDLNRHGIKSLITSSRPQKYYCKTSFSRPIEFEVAESGDSCERLLELHAGSSTVEIPGGRSHLASLAALAVIKRSHLFTATHWEKHISDYHTILGILPEMPVTYGSLLRLRIAETKLRHRDNSYSLDVDNDAFFGVSNKVVRRIYDHDSIHRVVSYYDEPLYLRAKHDRSKALVDKDLFEAMSFMDRVRMVREECYVIAIERQIVPRGGESFAAFNYALERICTTLTKGWFRDFAIEHWPIIKQYDKDYMADFLSGVARGTVRMFKS